MQQSNVVIECDMEVFLCVSAPLICGLYFFKNPLKCIT